MAAAATVTGGNSLTTSKHSKNFSMSDSKGDIPKIVQQSPSINGTISDQLTQHHHHHHKDVAQKNRSSVVDVKQEPASSSSSNEKKKFQQNERRIGR